jgi:hypothetical protein
VWHLLTKRLPLNFEMRDRYGTGGCISVLVLVLALPMTALARRDTGLPEWTFDDMAELADWQDHHDLAPEITITKVKDSNGVERSVLVIESVGANPYIYPGGSVPIWEPFSGYEHDTIYIGLRVERSDLWKVDYITSRNGEYNDEQSQEFEVDASRDFVDLEFKMPWGGMIRGFRIHPGTNENKRAEIDYISLQGAIIVTRSPRRLATTWGRIKDLF